jgi:hypothetical protein
MGCCGSRGWSKNEPSYVTMAENPVVRFESPQHVAFKTIPTVHLQTSGKFTNCVLTLTPNAMWLEIETGDKHRRFVTPVGGIGWIELTTAAAEHGLGMYHLEVGFRAVHQSWCKSKPMPSAAVDALLSALIGRSVESRLESLLPPVSIGQH